MLVLDRQEIDALAAMVSRVAPRESQLCQSALMWLAVNQMRQSCGRKTLAEICESLGVPRRCSAESAPSRSAVVEEGLSALRQRARSVLLAQEADPTSGACRMHRHDECPAWSEHVLPLALIGPFFFYPASVER